MRNILKLFSLNEETPSSADFVVCGVLMLRVR